MCQLPCTFSHFELSLFQHMNKNNSSTITNNSNSNVFLTKSCPAKAAIQQLLQLAHFCFNDIFDHM